MAHGLRHFLLQSRVPVVLLEADPQNAGALTGCDIERFAAFMYEDAGYVVTTEEAGYAPLSLPDLRGVIRALGADTNAQAGWMLRSGHWYFQRNDTVGVEARGGRTLPPFANLGP